jgi:hypothetical protein
LFKAFIGAAKDFRARRRERPARQLEPAAV